MGTNCSSHYFRVVLGDHSFKLWIKGYFLGSRLLPETKAKALPERGRSPFNRERGIYLN